MSHTPGSRVTLRTSVSVPFVVETALESVNVCLLPIFAKSLFSDYQLSNVTVPANTIMATDKAPAAVTESLFVVDVLSVT